MVSGVSLQTTFRNCHLFVARHLFRTIEKIRGVFAFFYEFAQVCFLKFFRERREGETWAKVGSPALPEEGKGERNIPSKLKQKYSHRQRKHPQSDVFFKGKRAEMRVGNERRDPVEPELESPLWLDELNEDGNNLKK